MKKMSGFTVIELMITLFILAILLVVAVPGFARVIEDNRVATQMNELNSAFALARAEAVGRGVNITVSVDNGSGGGTSYEDGWCVHSADECGSDTEILRHGPLHGVKLGNSSSAPTKVSFNRMGAVAAPLSNIAITFQPPSCSGDERARTLEIIGVSGRVAAVRRQACI